MVLTTPVPDPDSDPDPDPDPKPDPKPKPNLTLQVERLSRAQVLVASLHMDHSQEGG